MPDGRPQPFDAETSRTACESEEIILNVRLDPRSDSSPVYKPSQHVFGGLLYEDRGPSNEPTRGWMASGLY